MRRRSVISFIAKSWPWSVLIAGYAGIVMVMLAPVTNYSAFSSAIDTGDPSLLAWTFAWTSHAILSGHSLFDANVFYPAQPPLAFAEHHIGVGIWGLPLFALTGNPILVYSVLKIMALTLNAVAMHVFVWRWLRSHGPAIVAALIFSVSSTRLTSSGHVPLVWNCWLPLILIAVERWAATRQWKWILAASVLVWLQSLATWYLAVMTAVALGVFAVWRTTWAAGWLGGRTEPRAAAPVRGGRTLLLQAAVGALLVAVGLWPLASPYLALTGHAEVTSEAAMRYAADAGTYLQPPEGAPAAPLIAGLTGLPVREASYERSQFLGLVTVLLALIGTARWTWLAGRRLSDERQRPEVFWGGYFVLLAILAVALSFGPSSGGSIRTPFDLISKLPVLGMFRVPARFSVLVALAVSGLSALGFAQLQRLGRRPGIGIGAAIVPLMLFEWALPWSPGLKPAPTVTPPIYRVVASLDVHALVSLPCYRRTGSTWPMDADYMLYSTTHWRPIVNGYGKSEPPGFHWVVGAVNAFPGPNSAIRMRNLGIDYVVLHTARYPDGAAALLAEALASQDFRMVARVDDDYLFQVRPAPSS